MADIAMNGAPQIEPITAPPRPLTPRQPGAHDLCEPLGRLMRLRDLIGISQFPKIDLVPIFRARSALHAAFAAAPFRRIVGRWHLIGNGLASPRIAGVLKILQRRIVGRPYRARGGRARPYTLAQPEGVEQPVELVPVGFPRREEMLHRRSQ